MYRSEASVHENIPKFRSEISVYRNCTLKAACDQMPFDVEMIVVKIYSHFYLTTVRVANLKQFCDSVDVEYRKLLGYCKTRFLELLPAIDSVLRIFDALKAYFLEDPSSPKALKTFFKEPMAKIWLLFLKDQVRSQITFSHKLANRSFYLMFLYLFRRHSSIERSN